MNIFNTNTFSSQKTEQVKNIKLSEISFKKTEDSFVFNDSVMGFSLDKDVSVSDSSEYPYAKVISELVESIRDEEKEFDQDEPEFCAYGHLIKILIEEKPYPLQDSDAAKKLSKHLGIAESDMRNLYKNGYGDDTREDISGRILELATEQGLIPN